MNRPAGRLLVAALMLPPGILPSKAQTTPCASDGQPPGLTGSACLADAPPPGAASESASASARARVRMPVLDQGADERSPFPWRGLKMGMSVAEVLKLVPGASRREGEALEGGSRTRLVKEDVSFAGLKLKARYFFVDDRFDLVSYAPPEVFRSTGQALKDFEAVYRLLKAEYGEPTRSVGEWDGMAGAAGAVGANGADGRAYPHAVWRRAGGHSIVLAVMPTGVPGVAAMSVGYRTPLKDPDVLQRLEEVMDLDGLQSQGDEQPTTR